MQSPVQSSMPVYTPEDLYDVMPPIYAGGPTGLYIIPAPVKSAKWIEYTVASLASGPSEGQILLSTNQNNPAKPDFLGVAMYGKENAGNNGNSTQYGIPMTIAPWTTNTPHLPYTRIANPEGNVYLRVDTQPGSSVLVVILFRVRLLSFIPADIQTVHPEHAEQVNIQRAQNISKTLEAREKKEV